MTDDGLRAVAAASDPAAAALEEIPFALGEGPSLEAFSSRRPVLEPDLDASSTWRWPGYRAAAQQVGVRAVFAFPLQIGAARMGVLGVHRRSAGDLSPDTVLQSLTFAEVAVETLLDGQDPP